MSIGYILCDIPNLTMLNVVVTHILTTFLTLTRWADAELE